MKLALSDLDIHSGKDLGYVSVTPYWWCYMISWPTDAKLIWLMLVGLIHVGEKGTVAVSRRFISENLQLDLKRVDSAIGFLSLNRYLTVLDCRDPKTSFTAGHSVAE